MMIGFPLIDEMTDVSLELQRPSHAGHPLEFKEAGDRTASGVVTVFADKNLHRIFYWGGPADKTAGKNEGSAPFVSAPTSRDLNSFQHSDHRLAPPLI